MSTSLARLQKNKQLHSWYEDIQERQLMGLTISAWCEQKQYSKSTYYYRQKQVTDALNARLSEIDSKEDACVQFASLPAPSTSKNVSGNSILIRLGELEVEIPSGASRENIAAVIEALKC